MDIAAWVGVGVWVLIIIAVARDEARRESRHADVDALIERNARELAGRDT